jgi:hypothetical protein
MDRDDYTELLAHERHIEGRAHTSLGHFLAANAFMYTAWATLYAVDLDKKPLQTQLGIDFVLSVSTVIGYLWGLAWSSLGRRNWSMARRLVINLHELGSRCKKSAGNLPHLYEMLSATEIDGRDPTPEGEDRFKAKFKLSSNPNILGLTPLTMSGIYVALFTAWFLRRFTPPDAWLLLCCALAIFGFGLIVVVAVCDVLNERDLEARVTTAMKAAGVEKRIEDLWAKFPKPTK